MLDTNAVRVLLERRSPQLDQWFAEERCSLAAIVAAEIRFGLARQVLSGQHESRVSDLLDVLLIEAFDAQVASTHGLLQAERQRLGIRLSAMDLLIAAHAMAHGRTLVSRDKSSPMCQVWSAYLWPRERQLLRTRARCESPRRIGAVRSASA